MNEDKLREEASAPSTKPPGPEFFPAVSSAMALIKIIEAIEPFDKDKQRRTLEAAAVFLDIEIQFQTSSRS